MRSTHEDIKEYLKAIVLVILFESAKENFSNCIHSIELYPFVVKRILREIYYKAIGVLERAMCTMIGCQVLTTICFVLGVVRQEDQT